MSKIFAVNANNDLYLGTDGNLAVVTGITAVMQECQQAAQTRLGEMVLNIDLGVPYFEYVFNGVPNYAQFQAALRTAFLSVDNVTDVKTLNIVQDGDNLRYTAEIQTTFGNGVISG